MPTTERRLPPIGLEGEPIAAHARGRAMQRLRAVRRGAAALLFTLACLPVQAVLIRLAGRGKIRFARFYWAGIARLVGLRVRVIGAPAADRRGRPLVYACNHSSWLDIPALGGALEACFIAKAEVGAWPLIRTVARLGRTVFVSRRPAETGRERDDMRARLEAGDDLILFPEGTSSDGSRVLPFRSAFFSIAEAREAGPPPWIQPVSIVYDRLDRLPVGRYSRPVCAWYGDMELGSHFWRLARHPYLRATVLLHEPIDPALYTSRKALAQAVWRVVAEGAAALRQNRQAVPLQASGFA